MPDEILTHDEHLRLECLAQAVHMTLIDRSDNVQKVLETAAKFEEFVSEYTEIITDEEEDDDDE